MEEIIKEYKLWLKENQNFLINLREHDSSLYVRIQPIYEVLNYLVNEYKTNDLLDEDIIKIFQVGLEYLYSQIFTCKIYLTKYFNDNFHLFLEYDKIIGYLLYIEDLKYELIENKFDSQVMELNPLIDYLEDILIDKNEIIDNINLYVDAEISKVIDTSLQFHGIIDIFVEIAETFGLNLYEESEYIVGKDI